MTHRRSRLEICLEILSIIYRGTKKPTRIMYAANVSWKPLQRYLDWLISQGLIREVEPSLRPGKRSRKDKRSRAYYELTQKGENIIKYFRGARELFELEEFDFLRA